MKEYMEPEVEIIEYLLDDIIAKSVETSGNNQWDDIISSTASDSFESDVNDDENDLI